MQKQNIGSGMAFQAVMDMFDQHHKAMRNQSFSSAGLAIATTTSQFKTANTVTYTSTGVFKSKTTADNQALAAGTIVADPATVQEAVWLVLIDAAGTISTVKGAQATGSGLALIPELPATEVTPLGYIRIAVAAAAANFVAATTALNAAGVTATYVNLGFISPRFDSAQ